MFNNCHFERIEAFFSTSIVKNDYFCVEIKYTRYDRPDYSL